MKKVLDYLINLPWIEYLIQLPLLDKIVIGLSILIVVGIVFCIYNFLQLSGSSAKKLFEYTSAKEITRKQALENSYKSMGAQETKGLLNHIDRKISQSGFKSVIKNLNSEMYVIITLAIGFVGGIVAFIFLKSLLFSLTICSAVCLIAYLMLELRCTYAYKKEEKDLMMFMNLAHSYSVASDDLIQILDMTALHMSEPLRSKIQDACVEARISGNVSSAIRNLSLKIGHEKLIELLANFEIGSKYQANYAEMVETMSEDFRIYLKQKDEMKAQGGSAFVVQIILFIVGLVLVKMADSFMEMNTVADLLLHTGFGNFIIGYFVIIILSVIIRNIRAMK